MNFPARAAFYYPWYPQTWTVEGEHVFYNPDLGYYSSDSQEVVDRHIDCMDYAKIDVAIVSWWGPESTYEIDRIPLLLERTLTLGSLLKWAFYHEREGFGDPAVAKLQADLEYLKSTYADHEAIARVDGKPVVFVYNDGSNDDGYCEVADRWAQANADGEWYVEIGRAHV